MSLEIEQKEITDFETFTWGVNWRAVILSKEQRMDKDYYFARIVKFYGNQDNTFEYDIGNKSDEYAWIGRKIRFVGKMGPDKDPESKTFGKRIEFPAKTEEITIIDSKGNDRKKTELIKGRKVYDFTLPVNEENTKKIKTMIGPIAVNKSTAFQVVAGNEPPVGVTKDVFFNSTVEEIMVDHRRLYRLTQQEKTAKKNEKQ